MKKLFQLQHRIRPYSAATAKGVKLPPTTTEQRRTTLPHISLEHAQLQSTTSRTASKSHWNLGQLMTQEASLTADKHMTNLPRRPRAYTIDHQRSRNMEALLDQRIRPRASSLESHPLQPKAEGRIPPRNEFHTTTTAPTNRLDPVLCSSPPFDLPRLRINSLPESSTTCSPPKTKSLKGLYGAPNQPVPAQNRRRRSLVTMRKVSSFDT